MSTPHSVHDPKILVALLTTCQNPHQAFNVLVKYWRDMSTQDRANIDPKQLKAFFGTVLSIRNPNVYAAFANLVTAESLDIPKGCFGPSVKAALTSHLHELQQSGHDIYAQTSCASVLHGINSGNYSRGDLVVFSYGLVEEQGRNPTLVKKGNMDPKTPVTAKKITAESLLECGPIRVTYASGGAGGYAPPYTDDQRQDQRQDRRQDQDQDQGRRQDRRQDQYQDQDQGRRQRQRQDQDQDQGRRRRQDQQDVWQDQEQRYSEQKFQTEWPNGDSGSLVQMDSSLRRRRREAPVTDERLYQVATKMAVQLTNFQTRLDASELKSAETASRQDQLDQRVDEAEKTAKATVNALCENINLGKTAAAEGLTTGLAALRTEAAETEAARKREATKQKSEDTKYRNKSDAKLAKLASDATRVAANNTATTDKLTAMVALLVANQGLALPAEAAAQAPQAPAPPQDASDSSDSSNGSDGSDGSDGSASPLPKGKRAPRKAAPKKAAAPKKKK